MKALFVGLGSIGQRHLRNLLQLVPDVEILAVRRSHTVPVLSDTNQVMQDVNIAKHYGISEFSSLDAALTLKPDLVFVTNPSNLHQEVALKALDSGAFVFVEKPLSHDWKGIDILVSHETELREKRIAIGYQFRFHPVLKLVESLLAENRLGRLVGACLINGEYMPDWHPYEDYRNSYAARRDLGGGALVTQIHDFDYAMWLFGKPTKVFATGGHLSSLEIDVEDSVQVLMSCENNGQPLPVSLNLNYLQWPPKRGFSVTGDEGCIDCDLIANTVVVSNRVLGKIECHEFPNFDRNKMFVDELRNFLSFSVGEADPTISLADGTESLRIALAARQSMEQGGEVSLIWS